MSAQLQFQTSIVWPIEWRDNGAGCNGANAATLLNGRRRRQVVGASAGVNKSGYE